MDLTVEDIDRVRVSWFSDYPEILVSDIAAFLVRISQQTLFQLYRHSRKPIEAEMISAAAIYFYKFYMRESPRDFHPRAVLVACMNLAAKTEEYHAVGLSDLINALPGANELKASVPRLEMKLLAALDYNLVVEQPWLVVLFWAEMISTAEDNLHLKVYDIACDLVRMWQFTDAALLFSFPKIATAAVYKACKDLSSDGNNESLTARLEAAIRKIVPNTDVAELLLSVENVAHRFGPFEKVVKDPSVETTLGYAKLVSLSG
jgi:cyclin H